MPSEEETYRALVQKMLEDISGDVKETKMQTKLTNGRVSKLELRMSIAFTAIAVILILKFPDLLSLLHLAL